MEKPSIIGCSGGPDSMALLDWMVSKGFYVIVAHVNYQKRESALRDEKLVRAYCQNKGIPCFVEYPQFSKGQNFQAWARQVRYDFFVKLACRFEARGIYVAHQREDHLETYLFQKQRKMLCEYYGLKPVSSYRGIPLYRPLLDWPKKDCVAYCQRRNIEFGIDESNQTDQYVRNRIRHHCVDQMSEKQKTDLLHQIDTVNREWKEKQESARLFLKNWDQKIASLTDWYFLEEHLYQQTGERHGKKECQNLLDQIQTDCLIDLKDYEMESFQGKLWIVKKQAPVKIVLPKIQYGTYPGFTLANAGRTIEGVSVSCDDFPLTIRTVQKGDRIELRYGTKRLNRFFIDRKIPRVMRKNWLVMENASGRIIFVPQIGCDVQHFSAQLNLFMLQ